MTLHPKRYVPPSNPAKLKRVLVTGGAGFIGSHTVDLLLGEEIEVVVLDNLSSGTLTNLNLKHPNLEFIEGDILEYPLLKELMENCDALLHLAAISSVPLSVENPIYAFQVNTQGFLHALQAVYEAKKQIRLVYASSAAVYGDSLELPCSDEAPLLGQVISPYALQKIHTENYATLYANLYGIQSLGLRYFNVYGPRQDPYSPYSGVISHFLHAYKAQSELTIFGDGQNSRDFIHVQDVARANVCALQSNYAGFINIATGESQSILQLVECIEAAGQEPAKLRFESPRLGDIKSSFGTTNKAEQQIGFKFLLSLKNGIQQMLRQ